MIRRHDTSTVHLIEQLRQAYFGEEVQRIQRGREELRVMVRYPLAERRSLADIKAMRICSGLGYGVLRPLIGGSSAMGSLMRRKLEPVMGTVLEQIALLRRTAKKL